MCGIFGMFGHRDAARFAYLGLYALQHRGEESCGIITNTGSEIHAYKRMGLVADAFNENILKSLKGHLAIGHVRYSTTGSSLEKNIQPFLVNIWKHKIAIAHNGNITNTYELGRQLEDSGAIFQTTCDSELLAHLIAQSNKKDSLEMVVDALSRLEGAYSMCLMFDDMLIGARDPLGFRPLCLGKLNGSYILASETCALDLIQAKHIRDIEPGEVVFINKKGFRSIKPFPKAKPAFCIFEHIYFARPDSDVFGKNVYITRKRLGQSLCKESPADCDFVMPIPDSGTGAALGFSERAKVPFEMGMIRNHYIGRTFIQPSQLIRDFKVKVKLNPIRNVLKGKKVVVIEDSIVRGTTIKGMVHSLRKAGAAKVHMRISCPPLRAPCFYGIDFSTKKELIAAKQSVAQIKDFIGVDTLKYLSLKGMLESMLLPKEQFCTACFSKKYPTRLPRKKGKNILEEY